MELAEQLRLRGILNIDLSGTDFIILGYQNVFQAFFNSIYMLYIKLHSDFLSQEPLVSTPKLACAINQLQFSGIGPSFIEID